MTLDAFIAKYNGVRVGDGQCGTLVRAYWNEVDHTVPPSYTNSKDYWFNPVPGYDKVSSPQPGNIAIYDGHGTFTEGHSAIYVDGRVFEQNADPDGSPAHLFNRANTYLLGYLRKQGGSIMTEDGVRYGYLAVTRAQPTADQLKYWVGRDSTEFELALYKLSDEYYGVALAELAKFQAGTTKLKPGIYEV